MRRLVALTAVRQRNIPLILRAAADWAPYEHAKLAPLVVERPREAEEDKARRLHAALREMRETVGNVPQIRSEDSKPLIDGRPDWVRWIQAISPPVRFGQA